MSAGSKHRTDYAQLRPGPQQYAGKCRAMYTIKPMQIECTQFELGTSRFWRQLVIFGVECGTLAMVLVCGTVFTRVTNACADYEQYIIYRWVDIAYSTPGSFAAGSNRLSHNRGRCCLRCTIATKAPHNHDNKLICACAVEYAQQTHTHTVARGCARCAWAKGYFDCPR